MTAYQLGLDELPVDRIVVPTRLRAVDQDWVDVYAGSIAEKGLQQPIQVRKVGDGWELIAGAHRLWERLHPETRRGVAGGKARQRKGEPASEMFSFAADAAARIGLSQRAVQLAVKLWRDLTPEARELIEGTEIAGNGALLGRIASLPAEEQAGTVRAALVGEKGVRPEADPVLAQYEKLVRAWARSGEKARQRFRRFLAEEAAQ